MTTTAGSIARGAVVVLGGAQILLGLLWWVANLDAVPAYGDTGEYLALAETLEVDGFRTLAYPLVVRAALSGAQLTGIAWQAWVYGLQTVAVVGAVAYVLSTVLPHARARHLAFGTALVVTSPLVLHYAASGLSDSLATSFFVVALSGAARLVVRSDRRLVTVATTGVGALGAALLRTEKSVVLVAVAGLVAVGVLALARSRGAARAGTIAVLVGALVVPSLAAGVVNRVSQTADVGRPSAGLSTIIVSRAVWPHLEQIRGELPAAAREAVTVEDARAFDQHNNNAMPMTTRLQALDDGGDGLVRAAGREALRCCWVDIARDTLGDALEYTVTPVTFAVEALPVLDDPSPEDTPTAWNLTRMSAAHPSLTTVYLGVSFVVLALLIVRALADLLPSSRRRRRAPWTAASGILLLGTVVNGCAFAFAQGADANVRYGLSNVVVLTAVLVAAQLTPGARGAATDDRRPGEQRPAIEGPVTGPSSTTPGRRVAPGIAWPRVVRGGAGSPASTPR